MPESVNQYDLNLFLRKVFSFTLPNGFHLSIYSDEWTGFRYLKSDGLIRDFDMLFPVFHIMRIPNLI